MGARPQEPGENFASREAVRALNRLSAVYVLANGVARDAALTCSGRKTPELERFEFCRAFFEEGSESLPCASSYVSLVPLSGRLKEKTFSGTLLPRPTCLGGVYK